MRFIGSLSTEEQAKTLEDYLLTLNVSSRVLHGSKGWELWVQDEDQRERAEQVLEEFQVSPDDPKYATAGSRARKLRREAEREAKKRQKNFVDLRERWQPVRGQFPLTVSLMVISVAVTLGVWSGERGGWIQNKLSITEYVRDGHLIRWHSGLPNVQHGEVWRLVTPIFMHFGIIHLVFNMLMLLQLGAMVEARKGTLLLLVLVLVSAVLSNLGQYWIHLPPVTYRGPAFGGMSGVVYALFGYIWMKSRYDPGSGFYLSSRSVAILIGWFFICLIGILPIANAAHAVGLGVGVAIGIAPYAWRKVRGR